MASPTDPDPQSKNQEPLGFLGSWILDSHVQEHPQTGFLDVLGLSRTEVRRWE